MMETQSGSRFAAFGAVAAWLSLALQFYLTNALVLSQGRPFLDSIFVFFLYFTILTNLLRRLRYPTTVPSPWMPPKSGECSLRLFTQLDQQRLDVGHYGLRMQEC